KMGAAGELKDYVTYDEIEYQNGGATAIVNAHVRLPESIEKAGLNSLFIVFKEASTDSNMIGASVTIRKVINFEVLYPYKKVSVKLTPANTNVDEPTDIMLTVRSLTELDISKVNGIIKIYDSDDNLVKTFETETRDLPAGTGTSFVHTWDTAGHKAGNYHAEAIIFWDDNESTTSKVFKIGTLSVKISQYTDEFIYGAINKFEVWTESGWNEKIKHVYAELYIEGAKVGATPPASMGIEPWQTAILEGYFDASSYEIGEYDAKITVLFDGEAKTESFTAKMIDGDAPILDEKPELMGKSTNLLTTITIVLVIIILGNVLYFYLQKKKKKKDAPVKKNKQNKPKQSKTKR
ncbi:MAG: hypothetical protein ABIE94_07215, partial [archaeon]